MRLLGRLASAVVASGEAVWYTGETRDLAPQVEDAVQEYVDEAHSKTVAVLPLGRPAPPEEDDRSKREEPEPPIGALIVEQIEDSRVSASLVQRSDVVCQHSSAALANAMEHQSLFLMPVWRALGKTRWVVQGRTLPKTLSIAGAVLLLLLVLVVWPAKFSLEAKGTLEPIDRQYIFAAVNGVVDGLYVAHGDTVAKDQLLAKLRNTDLGVAMQDIIGKLSTANERRGAIERALSGRINSIEDRLKLEGEKAELKQTLRSLDAQLDLYKAKQLELNVRSPIAGIVLNFDLQDRLPIGRPVQRGTTLMRVADPNGPWQLELHMPENHIGHVVRQQQAIYRGLRTNLQELLRKETRAKSPDMPAEDVDKAVDEALAKVPDEELRAKTDAAYQQRFRAALETLRGEVTDPQLRAKLDAVLKEPAYDAELTKLDALVAELSAPPPEPAPQAPAPAVPQASQEPPAAQEPPKPAADDASKPAAEAAKPAADDASKPAAEAAKPATEEAPKPPDSQPGQVDNPPPQPPSNDALIERLKALPRDRAPDDRLEVTYILATEPSTKHYGRVQEIARSAEVHGDEGNTVLIKVREIDKSDLDAKSLKPGATVTAKVDCGRRCLGYVLLHNLIAFIQTKWFQYF